MDLEEAPPTCREESVGLCQILHGVGRVGGWEASVSLPLRYSSSSLMNCQIHCVVGKADWTVTRGNSGVGVGGSVFK